MQHFFIIIYFSKESENMYLFSFKNSRTEQYDFLLYRYEYEVYFFK